MLISFMSLLKFQVLVSNVTKFGKVNIRLLLTCGYCHDFTLLIPICEEVEKIYRDHSLHSSYHIVIPIYITQHFLCSTLLDKFSY